MKRSFMHRLVLAVLAIGSGVGAVAGARAAGSDQVVFSRWTFNPDDTGRSSNLLTTDSTGRPVRALTPETAGIFDREISWSPSGKSLAFARDYRVGNDGPLVSDIYSIRSNGSELRRLVHGIDARIPTWGPRGVNQIAFAAYPSDRSCVGLVNVDGTGRRELICPSASERPYIDRVLWFPDGKRLLVCYSWFGGGLEPPRYERLIEVDAATGASRVLLSDRGCPVSLSPDGGTAAFEGIRVLDLASGVERTLPGTEGGDRPVFSPDGRQIAFRNEILIGGPPYKLVSPLFVINTDGTDLRQVTEDLRDRSSYVPNDWSHDGKRVLASHSDGTASAEMAFVDITDGTGTALQNWPFVFSGEAWFEEEEGAIALRNGVTRSNLIGRKGEEKLYVLHVPTGASNLRITTTGGTGDVSLYVSIDEAPTPLDADYWSRKAGTCETIVIPRPSAGAYYIKVTGESAYRGVDVRARYGK